MPLFVHTIRFVGILGVIIWAATSAIPVELIALFASMIVFPMFVDNRSGNPFDAPRVDWYKVYELEEDLGLEHSIDAKSRPPILAKNNFPISAGDAIAACYCSSPVCMKHRDRKTVRM